MSTMNTKLIGAIGVIIVYAWTTKQPNNLEKAEWMIGTWKSNTPNGTIYETWSAGTNPHEFSGKSYAVKGKDTLIFETIQLVEEKDRLVYIPIVKNQNGSQPVRFTSKLVSESQLVFENQEHDFPQIISYTRIHADSLVAEISGTTNGKERKQTFAMKRIK